MQRQKRHIGQSRRLSKHMKNNTAKQNAKSFQRESSIYSITYPALKEAVEKSYVDCGWNLTESTNSYGSNLYPTFSDVTRNIKIIIDSSEYDSENKTDDSPCGHLNLIFNLINY